MFVNPNLKNIFLIYECLRLGWRNEWPTLLHFSHHFANSYANLTIGKRTLVEITSSQQLDRAKFYSREFC